MSISPYDSIESIISAWPSNSDLAADLDLKRSSHCRTIKARKRIPRAYWHDLVAAAERRGIPGVTIGLLKQLHSNVVRR